jgi:molecular chaperone DnaK
MPAVVDLLRQLARREPDSSIAADEAVAHGAALHASRLLAIHEGSPPPFSIQNVNSHSLGVVASDPVTRRLRNAIIIPRNTSLPVAAKRIFRTQTHGQKSVLVQIVEGESAAPDQCVQIGHCTLRDLPDDLSAQSPIEVRFRYAENGRLEVLVNLTGTDRWVQREINRETSMTLQQLQTWRRFVVEGEREKGSIQEI